MTADRRELDARAQLASTEVLSHAWESFRAGEAIACRRDDATFALAVDAAAGAYRFVCTHCGASSLWFESNATGLRVRHPMAMPTTTPTGDE